MQIKSLFYTIAFLAIITVITGCSNSGNPIGTPDNPQQLGLNTDNISLAVGVSDYDSNGNPIGGIGTMGLFTVHVEKKDLSGELLPLRSLSSTDGLEIVDITNFLQIMPCSDCAKLISIELDLENSVVVKIGIKHPFDVGDSFKPISGMNRADLHVFNVEGQVITDGAGATSFPTMGVSTGDSGLINADGYSGYLDSELDGIFPTDATLHPYILHFDDYSPGNYNPDTPTGFESVTDPPPSGNLVMAMGSDYDIQDYVFDFSGSLDFILAIGCTYAISAETKVLRFTPEYRVPQHNKKAASEVRIEIITNDLKSGDLTSTADLEIYVVDFNHGVPEGIALDEMYVDSSVSDVSVEVPGVTITSVSFGNMPVSGTGHDPSDPLVFTGSISNEADGASGIYKGLVKVLDNYSPGLNQSPLLNGQDGIHRVEPLVNPVSGLFTINEFATYTVFDIEVASGEELVAVIDADPIPPDALTCETIDFDGSGSYDSQGFNIVEYQWDWDYTGDPLSFVADLITVDPYASHQYITEGLHSTGLRVVNDDSPPTTSEPEPLEHTLVRVLPSEFIVQEVNKVSDTFDDTEELWMPSSNAIVVDRKGVVHIFAKLGNDLVHYSYDYGTADSEIIGSLSGYAHQSAQIDSNDVIHLVWTAYSDPEVVMYYSENSLGTWAAPLEIASILDWEKAPYSYSMGINGQDELMVVWQELFTDNHYMQYLYKTDTGWTSPEIIQSTETETGSPSSELAVMVSCAGTPGDTGSNFHAMWTEQFNPGYMNPCVRYAKFDRATETWSAPEWVADDYYHYQDWSDMWVTSDGGVYIGSSIVWDNCWVGYKDPTSGLWQKWMIATTPNDEYTATIGVNNDGTVCVAYWERIGYPNEDPFEVHYKVFHKGMDQAEVDAITPLPLDPSSTTYEYRYGDIFMKECSFYVAFLDRRDSLGGAWDLYYARIGN